MIPLGSLTANHEIVNGTVTEAPSAGATGAGAGGPEGLGGVGVGVGFPWRADVGCDDTPTTSIVRAKMSESVMVRDRLMTKLQSMCN